jgi:hypothetical protein
VPTYTSDRFRYNAASKTLTAAASDLGLKPGAFPRRMEIRHRGIGVFLADEAERTADNELACVRYRQTNGPCFAVIFND